MYEDIEENEKNGSVFRWKNESVSFEIVFNFLDDFFPYDKLINSFEIEELTFYNSSQFGKTLVIEQIEIFSLFGI